MKTIILAVFLCLAPVAAMADYVMYHETDGTPVYGGPLDGFHADSTKDGFLSTWTWADTAYQAAFLAATYAGYEQVNNALDKAARYDSYGMTERPSFGTINTAFIAFAATHTAIAAMLPTEYRRTWQAIGIGIGVGVNTYAIGLNVSLK